MGITTKTGLNENGQSSSVFEGRAIGDIIPHFGTTAPPGTLVCDGSEVSREAYAELFEEIGSLCGQGDGSTTFNLPDLRGRWMMGADAERAVGEEVAEGVPNVTGTFGPTNIITLEDYSGSGIIEDESGVFFWRGQGINFGRGSSSEQHVQWNWLSIDASRLSKVYGASAHVTPASVAVLPCIVYE